MQEQGKGDWGFGISDWGRGRIWNKEGRNRGREIGDLGLVIGEEEEFGIRKAGTGEGRLGIWD
jgi:hypothetical protein